MQLPPRLEDTKVHKEFIFNDLFFGANLCLGALWQKSFWEYIQYLKFKFQLGIEKIK
jgi:hypothetical protein